MEYIIITSFGILAVGIIVGFAILNETIIVEGKKTRKESQEIKTRLTQVRKDLNTLERR